MTSLTTLTLAASEVNVSNAGSSWFPLFLTGAVAGIMLSFAAVGYALRDNDGSISKESVFFFVMFPLSGLIIQQGLIASVTLLLILAANTFNVAISPYVIEKGREKGISFAS